MVTGLLKLMDVELVEHPDKEAHFCRLTLGNLFRATFHPRGMRDFLGEFYRSPSAENLPKWVRVNNIGASLVDVYKYALMFSATIATYNFIS